MVSYVEHLLRENLELPASFEVQVEQTHCTLMPRPPSGTSLRSIVAKLSNYRMKIVGLAWQERRFQLFGRRNLDHDYALDVLKGKNMQKQKQC